MECWRYVIKLSPVINSPENVNFKSRCSIKPLLMMFQWGDIKWPQASGDTVTPSERYETCDILYVRRSPQGLHSHPVRCYRYQVDVCDADSQSNPELPFVCSSGSISFRPLRRRWAAATVGSGVGDLESARLPQPSGTMNYWLSTLAGMRNNCTGICSARRQ